MGFLGLLQGGLLLALEPTFQRWLQRPKPWRFTILVNARIMTLYLWHLTAMVAVIGISLALKGFGLHSEPLSGAWWATRPVWWAVLAVVTVGFIAIFGRFENPPRDQGAASLPAWRPVAATILGCGGLGFMAAHGIVGPDGVHWWWPLLPILAVLLLRTDVPAKTR